MFHLGRFSSILRPMPLPEGSPSPRPQTLRGPPLGPPTSGPQSTAVGRGSLARPSATRPTPPFTGATPARAEIARSVLEAPQLSRARETSARQPQRHFTSSLGKISTGARQPIFSRPTVMQCALDKIKKYRIARTPADILVRRDGDAARSAGRGAVRGPASVPSSRKIRRPRDLAILRRPSPLVAVTARGHQAAPCLSMSAKVREWLIQGRLLRLVCHYTCECLPCFKPWEGWIHFTARIPWHGGEGL